MNFCIESPLLPRSMLARNFGVIPRHSANCSLESAACYLLRQIRIPMATWSNVCNDISYLPPFVLDGFGMT